jgi:hypothetical protein
MIKTAEAMQRKLAYDREWRKRNRDKVLKSALKHYYKKRAVILEERAKNPQPTRPPKQSERRLIILNHYSNGNPHCNCCGEKEIKFLAIDHINNNGAAHRREVGAGTKMWKWIIDNNFPNTFQILCHNCNMAKAFYGECPHGHIS